MLSVLRRSTMQHLCTWLYCGSGLLVFTQKHWKAVLRSSAISWCELIKEQWYTFSNVGRDWIYWGEDQRRANLSLFGPMSLTSVICYVLEAILKEKMLAHSSPFSLLSSRRHGFLPQRSTLPNLTVVEELITKWFHEGSAVDLIYLGFSIAFRAINHRLLLAKFRGYGIASIVIIRGISSEHRWNPIRNGWGHKLCPPRLCYRPGTVSHLRQWPARLLVCPTTCPRYVDDIKLIAPVTAMIFSKTPQSSALYGPGIGS